MKKINYPNNFKKSINIIEIKKKINEINKYYFLKKEFSICGRVFKRRSMGGISFIDIKDFTEKIQLYLTIKNLKNYKDIITNLKIGDIIGVNGLVFKTKTNEISLEVKFFIFLSKNINTFPDKHVGLIDKEICYRKRYIDLIMNEKSKNIFIFRSNLINFIRNFFIEKNFIELETPILQHIVGGADARPFKTYHNYLKKNLYLRIAPELFLKKIIVGGFEKVFEIGKNFRNEGTSTRHNPEFTMIEFYEAYKNYKDLMKLTEILFISISNVFFKSKKIIYNNVEIDFSKNFEKINFDEAIIKYCKYINKNEIKSKKKLIDLLKKNDIQINKKDTVIDLKLKIFENLVEKNLIQPTFIIHHPKKISPLAKETYLDNKLTERFELYIGGKEIANGFSELNDPIEQEKRFMQQLKNKKKIKNIDKDYIDALKYGLPPTAGEGIGIDRVIMLFSNSQSIKDIILFPFMKDKKNE